jgi:hypothetical protein
MENEPGGGVSIVQLNYSFGTTYCIIECCFGGFYARFLLFLILFCSELKGRRMGARLFVLLSATGHANFFRDGTGCDRFSIERQLRLILRKLCFQILA